MTQEMYNLINDNYTELLNNYCKLKDKKVLINNSLSCEDIFNDKILGFIETNIDVPTIEMLKLYIKTKTKKSRKKYQFKEYLYTEVIDENLEVTEVAIKLLFIDYRKK